MRWLLVLGYIRDLSRRASSRALKKSASFLLALNRSSTYPEGTPAVCSSAAALLDDLFEHPAGVFPSYPKYAAIEAILPKVVFSQLAG